MWSNFWMAGGFGMYPTAIFGFLLVAASVIYLLRPERRFLVPAAVLSAVTFAAGLLGATVGIVKTFHYIWQVKPEEQLAIAAQGVAESLNDLVLGLAIVVLAGLVTSAGAVRAARAAGAGASAVAPRADIG